MTARHELSRRTQAAQIRYALDLDLVRSGSQFSVTPNPVRFYPAQVTSLVPLLAGSPKPSCRQAVVDNDASLEPGSRSDSFRLVTVPRVNPGSRAARHVRVHSLELSTNVDIMLDHSGIDRTPLGQCEAGTSTAHDSHNKRGCYPF